ncbi:hypothetical protein KZZ07_21190 [Mameliella sp. CS4]|uniref:hypothetical protein n=1 Tax=Mameliella sp. CS4 TaxID=2862329 RepID=UPI001C5FCACA|nr:hypothetical protein [Mameliella sp. CS4]MBW4985063.1 hypothetical protein [Mameliella sp. CS4]
MTPENRLEFITRTGEALYGARWQTPLAEDLKTSDRTVRRWISGQNEVPWGVMAELRGLLMARGACIHELLAEMDNADR